MKRRNRSGQIHGHLDLCRKIAPFLGVVVLVCFVSAGCSMSYAGGGTTGTGLPYSSYGSGTVEPNVAYFELQGVLLDKKRRPLSGVDVEVGTELTSDSVVTDHLGRFTIFVVVGENEELAFHFKSKDIDAQYVHQNIPLTTTAASCVFALSSPKTVVPVKLDFSAQVQ